MSAIGPGDWVVCVDDGPLEGSREPSGLHRGHLYNAVAIVEIPPGFSNSGQLELVVEEVSNPWGGGFRLTRFRPIPRSSEITSLIEKLNTGAPLELEPVEGSQDLSTIGEATKGESLGATEQ